MRISRFYGKLEKITYNLDEHDLQEAVFDYLQKRGVLSNIGSSTFDFDWKPPMNEEEWENDPQMRLELTQAITTEVGREEDKEVSDEGN